MSEVGLAYDLLVHERQLPEAIRFVNQHSEQIFVLYHLAPTRHWKRSGRLD